MCNKIWAFVWIKLYLWILYLSSHSRILEENVVFKCLLSFWNAWFHQVLDGFDSVRWWSTSFWKFMEDEVTVCINILDRHVFLVELDCSCNVCRWNPYNIGNIFENHKTIRQIFPKESCIVIQSHLNVRFWSWF